MKEINNTTMKTGIELIAQEREEQIEKHGHSIKLDIQYNQDFQLQIAAVKLMTGIDDSLPPEGWDKTIWKYVIKKSLKSRLIIAGALIAAEIDRLQNMKS